MPIRWDRQTTYLSLSIEGKEILIGDPLINLISSSKTVSKVIRPYHRFSQLYYNEYYHLGQYHGNQFSHHLWQKIIEFFPSLKWTSNAGFLSKRRAKYCIERIIFTDYMHFGGLQESRGPNNSKRLSWILRIKNLNRISKAVIWVI